MIRTLKSSALVVASLWVGILFCLGFVVVPYLFALAARHSPAVPNTGIAAELIGPLLYSSDVAGLVVGSGLLLALFLLRRRHEVPMGGKVFLSEIGVGVAVVCAAVNYWMLAPRLKLIQGQLAERYGAFHQADRTDPVFQQFSGLHQTSTVLFMAGFAAALVCLVCMTQFRSRLARGSETFEVTNGTDAPMNMNYDVEADFLPLTTCNFRCDYCFLAAEALGARLRTYGSNEQWQEGFDATAKTWLIHVTGGEPFIYPGFVDLCERLSRRHYLSINSNLSHQSVDDFAVKVDPGRVHFINAAIHPEERQKRASLSAFVARVQRLQGAGFNVLASLVMTPQAMRDFPAIADYFNTQGLAVVPKVMRGLYEGKTYPEAYSVAEKALFLRYLAEARRRYADVLKRMGEPPTIDMFSDWRFLDGVRAYHGKLCGSGHNFATISPDGTVVRCGSRETLGNILLKTVRLLSGPKPCDASYCPYFCEKYTSPRMVGGLSR